MHLDGLLQMPVGGTLAAKADAVDGATFPDAGEDVLQDAAVRMVVEDVVDDHGRDAGLSRQA
ncbi:hypothetical protein D3C85_495980 [compost metagenome]